MFLLCDSNWIQCIRILFGYDWRTIVLITELRFNWQYLVSIRCPTITRSRSWWWWWLAWQWLTFWIITTITSRSTILYGTKRLGPKLGCLVPLEHFSGLCFSVFFCDLSFCAANLDRREKIKERTIRWADKTAKTKHKRKSVHREAKQTKRRK